MTEGDEKRADNAIEKFDRLGLSHLIFGAAKPETIKRRKFSPYLTAYKRTRPVA